MVSSAAFACITKLLFSTGPDVPRVQKNGMSQMCHQKDRWSKEDSRTEDHTHWVSMQAVAVDIMGPLPTTSDGNRYVLVAGDYFTKWVEA